MVEARFITSYYVKFTTRPTLKISLVNDSKIEIRVVFDHRLVCADTHRAQTFLRFK